MPASFDVWNPIIRLRGVREPSNGDARLHHRRARCVHSATTPQRESVIVIITVNH